MNYLVKKDFGKYRPTKWSLADKKLYGERNEGFIIEADSINEVSAILKEEYNLNPWYLEIKAQ